MRVRTDVKAVLIAVTLSLLSAFAAAQEQKPNTPVFKAKTELVLVPAGVHDKSGKHAAERKQAGSEEECALPGDTPGERGRD